MKMAFVKAPIGGILGLEMLTFVEPLGLISAAASAEAQGHECKVFDLRLDGREPGLEACERFAPDVVGLQCNFTTERFRSVDLAREIRRRLPGAKIIVGGHDASRDPVWFDEPAIDAIVIGDGEEVLPYLLEAFDRDRDFSTIPGLAWHRDGSFHRTTDAPMRDDLDTLPLPARHLIAHYAPHYYINFRKPLALFETARGCPFKCNFCSVWKFHKSTFREKSPERVVEELRTIEAPNVFITDDIFWMDVKRGEEMAKAIKAAGIRKYFTVQTRTDIICKFPHLIEMWKDCGDLAIFLGLESVTDEGLKLVNKKNTADNNRRALEILRELGVGYTPNFIVDPAWDHEDFTRLREWVSATGAFNSGFSILTPLPGTDLWSEASRNVTTHDWEMFDIVHTVLPTKLPMDEFYAEYSRLWRHVLDVRYQHRGRARTYIQLGAALATGRVSLGAVRKGMNMAKVFSRPETFLAAHRERPNLPSSAATSASARPPAADSGRPAA